MKAHLLERLASLTPIINEICAIGGVPGLSLGVAFQGRVVHTANFGYRDVEESIRPDADTLYGLASITKIFTASAVGSLVSEGKLQWVTPIADILPDLKSTDSIITQQLNILDLLTHRTGLEKSNYWWFGSDGVMLLDKSQTLSSFNALKQTSPFRAKYDYTNWGYALAGEVIEKLSDMSFGDYLQSRIFEPLQLDRTTVKGNYTTLENFAKPYAALDDASFYPVPPPAVQDGTILVGAQGVRSSINDLLKFSGALLQARKGEPSPLKNTAKQFSGQIFRNDALLEKSYGLGLMKNQLPTTIGGGCNSQFVKLPIITPGGEARLVVSHGGSQLGYTSFLTMLPEIDVSFAVLTNSVGLADPTGWVN
jgi:CubicO group peptidase (beta-lactamase class C family)